MNKLKSLSLLVAIATLAACSKEKKIVIETRQDKTVGEAVSDKYHATKDRAGEAYDSAKNTVSDKYHATKDRTKEAIHNATK